MSGVLIFIVTNNSVIFRGGKNTFTRRRQQVQRVLADAGPRLARRRYSGRLPGAEHPASAPDPQHGHHDGHLRGGRLYPDLTLPVRVLH